MDEEQDVLLVRRCSLGDFGENARLSAAAREHYARGFVPRTPVGAEFLDKFILIRSQLHFAPPLLPPARKPRTELFRILHLTAPQFAKP